MAGSKQQQSQWEHSRLFVEAEPFFQRLLECIGQAKRTIDFEYYIFARDRLGRQFQEALSAASRRGVRVRVLMDGIGSAAGAAELSGELFRTGVHVRIYHPLPWLSDTFRWSRRSGGWLHKAMYYLLNINRRNHRKLCVVDDHTAWLGSFNISDDHLPREGGGKGWRDYGVEVTGVEVSSLVSSFDLIWASENPRFHRGFLSRYLSNRSLSARRLKNRFVARSVARARQRVWLVSAYFAPTAGLRRALLRACREGRDVRLLLPGISDVGFFPSLSSHYYRELLRAGARIFLYQGGVLHAKALLVDQMAIVGSSNWNYRSTLHDLELDAVIREEDTLEALERTIAGDCRHARELDLDQTPTPSLLSWLWYLLRHWM
jgi:cardiolipin synthase